jgi:hypothetical protein
LIGLNNMASSDNKHIPIQCPPEVINGVYTNFSIVNHTSSEFVVDFIFVHPNTKTGEVRSRVIMHANHVRRLIETLEDNLGVFSADERSDTDNREEDFDDDDPDNDDPFDDGLPPITLNFN